MKRKFAKISERELESKILRTFDKHIEQDGYRGSVLTIEKLQYDVNYVWPNLTPTINNDLKVKFDCENVNVEGFKTLSNGLTYLGISAGGDWEHPVFFIIYWDGSKLRAYIPTKGNPYNTDTMQAYGNATYNINGKYEKNYISVDDKNCIKRFGLNFNDVSTDMQLIMDDIKERF